VNKLANPFPWHAGGREGKRVDRNIKYYRHGEGPAARKIVGKKGTVADLVVSKRKNKKVYIGRRKEAKDPGNWKLQFK